MWWLAFTPSFLGNLQKGNIQGKDPTSPKEKKGQSKFLPKPLSLRQQRCGAGWSNRFPLQGQGSQERSSDKGPYWSVTIANWSSDVWKLIFGNFLWQLHDYVTIYVMLFALGKTQETHLDIIYTITLLNDTFARKFCTTLSHPVCAELGAKLKFPMTLSHQTTCKTFVQKCRAKVW